MLKALSHIPFQELSSAKGMSSALPKVTLPSRVSLHPRTSQCEVQGGAPLQDHPAPEPLWDQLRPLWWKHSSSTSTHSCCLLSSSDVTPRAPSSKPPARNLPLHLRGNSSWGARLNNTRAKNIRKDGTQFRARALSPHINFFPKHLALLG